MKVETDQKVSGKLTLKNFPSYFPKIYFSAMVKTQGAGDEALGHDPLYYNIRPLLENYEYKVK